MSTRYPRAAGSRQAATARPRPRKEVVYPESDGKPMGESDLHRDEMIRLIQILQAFVAALPAVYVSGNLILYYVQGDARRHISPDVFVVKGVAKHRRRTYRLWEEAAAPCFVIEVTSSSTRREDLGPKRALYARMGVQEYFLYDPTGDWVAGGLAGYRLGPAGYEAVAALPDGGVPSEELGLRLAIEEERLQFYDARTGERLLSPEERAEAEAERAEAEVEARRLAEARVTAAEARIAELEALLHERGRRPFEPSQSG